MSGKSHLWKKFLEVGIPRVDSVFRLPHEENSDWCFRFWATTYYQKGARQVETTVEVGVAASPFWLQLSELERSVRRRLGLRCAYPEGRNGFMTGIPPALLIIRCSEIGKESRFDDLDAHSLPEPLE